MNSSNTFREFATIPIRHTGIGNIAIKYNNTHPGMAWKLKSFGTDLPCYIFGLFSFFCVYFPLTP